MKYNRDHGTRDDCVFDDCESAVLPASVCWAMRGSLRACTHRLWLLCCRRLRFSPRTARPTGRGLWLSKLHLRGSIGATESSIAGACLEGHLVWLAQRHSFCGRKSYDPFTYPCRRCKSSLFFCSQRANCAAILADLIESLLPANLLAANTVKSGH